jgi:hypothetical protein
LHCFVERASPLDSVAAWLEGRQPVWMPVDRVVFQLTLDHFGVAEPDVERWGGALVPARSYDEQLALYRAGTVNGLWQFMGIPSPSIEAANTLRPLRPLAFSESLIVALERLGWTPATLPAGAYGIVDRPVPTVAMGTSLGFHVEVADASCTRSFASSANSVNASAGSTRRRPGSIRRTRLVSLARAAAP